MTQAFLHHLGSFVARASQTHADDQQMQARLQQLADNLSPKQNLGCGSLYVLGSRGGHAQHHNLRLVRACEASGGVDDGSSGYYCSAHHMDKRRLLQNS